MEIAASFRACAMTGKRGRSAFTRLPCSNARGGLTELLALCNAHGHEEITPIRGRLECWLQERRSRSNHWSRTPRPRNRPIEATLGPGSPKPVRRVADVPPTNRDTEADLSGRCRWPKRQ